MSYTTAKTNKHTATIYTADRNKKVSVIIPVAGAGHRMRANYPKCLIELNGITVLENQLKWINKYLHKPEIIIVAGFQRDKVRDSLKYKRNVKLVTNYDWRSTNVVNSIHLGLEESSHPNILVVYGDLVFNQYTLKAPFANYSMIITDKSGGMKNEEVGYISQNNLITQMMYDLPDKWAQIAYFTQNESKLFKQLCAIKEHQNCFGFEIINKMIDLECKITSFSPAKMQVTDIDYPKDIKTAEEII